MVYSDFRILATIGQPEQVAPLLALSCRLAQTQDGAVTVLCVTEDGVRPDWLAIPSEYLGVPVRTVVRTGRNAARMILDASRSL